MLISYSTLCETNQLYISSILCICYGGGIKKLSVEPGMYAAFGVGVPLAVWGFLSYLRENTKSKNYNESRANYEKKEGKTVKRYTSDGKPVYE